MEQPEQRASLVRPASHREVTPGRIADDANANCFYSFLEAMLLQSRAPDPELFLAPGFRDHFGDELRDRTAFVASLAEHLAHIPDAAWTIEVLAGVGAVVLCHITAHSGQEGRTAWENFVVRFDAGTMVECWRSWHGMPLEPRSTPGAYQ